MRTNNLLRMFFNRQLLWNRALQGLLDCSLLWSHAQYVGQYLNTEHLWVITCLTQFHEKLWCWLTLIMRKWPPPSPPHTCTQLGRSWVVGGRVGSVVPSWRARLPMALYKTSWLRKAPYNSKCGDAQAAFFGKLLWLPQAPRLSDLEMYFLTVLEARNRRSRCP